MLSTIKFHHFFLLALFIRFIFLLCGYLFNLEPSSCCDWSRYNEISNNIVDGNFNLDAGPFVIAPIFPYFVSPIIGQLMCARCDINSGYSDITVLNIGNLFNENLRTIIQ